MTQEQINQLKKWNIEIAFFDRGCLVRVGCKSFAFESIEQAMAELTAYTKYPIEIGKVYAPMEFVELKECLEQRHEPRTHP